MTGDLVTRLRELANHRSSILGKRPEEMEEWMAADEIEDLKTRLAGCRAGFDRLARQVDGFSRAGKKADSWRKKT